MQVILIIFVVSCLAFFPALFNGFVNRDDDLLLLQNPLVQQLSLTSVTQIFASFRQFFYYMPLVFLSFAIERYFFGLNPFPYHLTNLVLHAANAVFVYAVAQAVLRNRRQAVFAALLFAVHPLRAESVAWVSGRKDVLFAFFFLASVWTHLLFISSGRIRHHVLSILCFFLSLLSKPMALVLPFALLLFDKHAGRGFIVSLREKIVYFALMSVSLLIALMNYSGWDLNRQAATLNGLSNSPFNLLRMTDALVFYLQKIIWPARLSHIYPFPFQPGQLIQAPAFVSPVIVGALIIITVVSLRKFPLIFLCLGFFFVTIAPPLFFSLTGGLNDRFTYLPSIGLSMLAARGLFWLHARGVISSRGIQALLVSFVLSLSILTWGRCRVWKDSVSLWSDAIRYEPRYSMPYNGRGASYLQIGDVPRAMEDLNRAIELNPQFVFAYLNRGQLNLMLKRHKEAVSDFKKAVELAPFFEPAKQKLQETILELQPKVL